MYTPGSRRFFLSPYIEIIGKSTLIDEATREKLIEESLDWIIPTLSEAAAKVDPGTSSVIALDWLNGRQDT